MTNRYYSLGIDGEFEEHDTLTEAESSAQEWIDLALDDTWAESTDRIEYGALVPLKRATECDRRDEPDDDFERERWKGLGCDHTCDYELLPVASEKRDESRDVWVSFESVNCLQFSGSVKTEKTRVVPSQVLNFDSLLATVEHKRFAPLDHLQSETARRIAAEALSASLSQAVTELSALLGKRTEAEQKLRAFVERISTADDFEISPSIRLQSQRLLEELSK